MVGELSPGSGCVCAPLGRAGAHGVLPCAAEEALAGFGGASDPLWRRRRIFGTVGKGTPGSGGVCHLWGRPGPPLQVGPASVGAAEVLRSTALREGGERCGLRSVPIFFRCFPPYLAPPESTDQWFS